MRRVAASLVAAALVLTACSANGDEESGEADGDAVAQGGTFTTFITRLDATAPTNPYNPDGNSFLGFNSMRLAWTANHPTDPRHFYPGLAENWEWNDDFTELVVELNPEAVWSDGEPVTTEDVVVSSNIAYTRGSGAHILQPGAAGSVSDAEVIDEHTIQFNQDPEEPTGTFINGILEMVVVPAHIYGELLPDDFADVLETARGEDEAGEEARERISEVGDEVIEFQPEEDISAGPFILERINPSEALLTRNEQFFDNDMVAPDNVVVRNYTGNEQIWDFLQAGDLDFGPFVATPTDVMESIEAVDGNQGVESYSPVVASMSFNQSHEPFDDLNVRRGLAYAIDYEQMVEVGSPTGGTAPVTTSGIHGEVLDNWLGDAAGDLEVYDQDLDRATEEFEEAGLTQENGQWLLPDGSPFEVPIQVVDGFTDWVDAADNVATQFQEFGIDADVHLSPDSAVHEEQMFNGEFPVQFWLIGLGPDPYNIYQRIYGQSGGWTVSAGQLSYAEPGEGTNWMGLPESLEVDGYGEINPGELAHEINRADEERVAEIMETLAHATNQHLPGIQMWDYINTQFENTNRFVTEPPEDARRLGGTTNPAGVWMSQGWITVAE
ncbi:MAG TPA: ABC transporter substrate-binding protein [Beutenbergiaceae bacterium]|nr:ABC transporter substrate-binding protein [Beutenbergiaceae bacterium]